MIDIEFLNSTQSTMDEAREHVIDGRYRFDTDAPICYCLVANEQTGGRGQRGRQWFARAGESLAVTYTVRCPPITEPALSHRIGIIAGVALAEVVVQCCPDMNVGLKWPNDLMLNGKKAGGILVEMLKSPAGDSLALIGIGVNVAVREFPPELMDAATSLIREGVAEYRLPDLRTLAYEIGVALDDHLQRNCVDPADCIRSWRGYDATTGRRFVSTVDDVTVRGVAEGIDNSAALLLRLDTGVRLAVTSATSLREISRQ